MLPHYTRFADAVSRLRAASSSLSAFTITLKEDKHFLALRNKARSELQTLYNVIRNHFNMPEIPVYLPARKKIMVRGRAFTHVGMPREIRIYPIHGPAMIQYDCWKPQHILIDSPDSVLETIIHESGHILEAHRYSIMGHEHNFVSAYCEIESCLVKIGVVKTIDSSLLRFSGCPDDSYAATLFGRCA